MIAVATVPDLPPKAEPPAIVAPAPYEVSFGRIAGRAAPGTVRLVVRAGGRTLADRRLRSLRFSFTVALPRRDVTVRVTAVDAAGDHATTTTGPVFGLPRSAAPVAFRGYEDPVLARRLRALAETFPGTAAVYVQDLATGAGAAWNARAQFPAASTLKLAIAVTALTRLAAPPAPGSHVESLFEGALIASDNAAANALEVLFGGSTSGGSAIVNATMRSLGLADTEMYGGYELNTAAGRRPIPLRVDEQPAWGVGKRTSAYDLARLLSVVHRAAGGRGPLVRLGMSPREARWLLYLLAHTGDRGKLDRFVGGRGGVAVPHKAGWIRSARHDAGVVYWPGGAFVAVVMTYGPGVGAASDVLAGRVAELGLLRFAQLRRATPYDERRDAAV